MDRVIFIILFISVAGPIVGSLIGIIKKPSHKFMYVMLAFAAGIMLSIAFLELIPESIAFSSVWIAVFGVFVGALFMYGIDKLIPHIHPELCGQEQGGKLKRTATYLIFGIFLHNIPEGIAIAIGTASDVNLSLVIALALAVHNIPEGICTSAPYFKTTGKRLKSFLISSSTVIPILIGFFIAYFLFQSISGNVFGFIIGATAGLMIYITADELIPTSCSENSNHAPIFALIFGILFVLLLGLI
ncbi:MAG: ZIP family metal transporter [archaeon]